MKTIPTRITTARGFSAFLQSNGFSVFMGFLALCFAVSSLAAQTTASGQVTLASILSVTAGGGSTVPSTTSGPATSAKLSAPSAAAVDALGNLYIADAGSNLVEQVSPAGQIVVIAGGGSTVPSTTSEAATSAKLNHPTGVAVDASGNVYIADQGNALIEEVSAGQIVVLAGGGGTVPGTSPGTATQAKLTTPTGVAVNAAGTAVYVADQGLAEIWEVTAGTIQVVAGGGGTAPSTTPEGALSAQLTTPAGVAVDSAGNFYIADTVGLVEEVTAGQIVLLAGGGSTAPSLTPEPGYKASLGAPIGVAVDNMGNLYIADQGNNQIEEVNLLAQSIVVVAGGGSNAPQNPGIPATAVGLNGPTGVAINTPGTLFIADAGNHLAEGVQLAQAQFPTTAIGLSSAVETLQVELLVAGPVSSIGVPKAANGSQEFVVGTVTGCNIGGSSNPAGSVCTVPVTFSPAYPGLRTGTLTVSNGTSTVGTVGLYGIGLGPEVVQSPGALSVIAGGGSTIPVSGSGTAALGATMTDPTSVAVDAAGNLYVATGNDGTGEIEEISASTGMVTLVAGGGATVPSITPSPATSALIYPFGIAVDGAGNIYIADYGNAQVEEVDATTNQIVVLAGGVTGWETPSTTPVRAIKAQIYPFGVAVDLNGNLYIADYITGGGLVEEVPADTAQLVVVAGCNSWCGSEPSPTPEPATAAGFYQVIGVTVDGAGNLYIADAGDDEVAMVTASTGQIVRIAGFGPNLPGSIPTPGTEAALNTPSSLAVDAAGNVYIADTSNGQIEQVYSPAGLTSQADQIVRVAGGGATPVSSGPVAATSAQLNNPIGVAIDGAGNIYIADSSNNRIEKVTAAALPLAFTDTYVEATNATQQTVTLGNIGNQTLDIASVSTAADFPTAGASTCSASAQTLTPGTTCWLVYDFLPTVPEALDETVALTDNSLNAPPAQQTISLTGTGVAYIASYTIAVNPTAVTVKAGQNGTATVTVTPSGGYTGSLTLSCTNLPVNTLCVFSQSGTVTLNGSNQAVPVTLTIQTNLQQTAAAPASNGQSPLNSILPALAICFPGGLLGLAAFRRRKNQDMERRRQRLLGIGLLVLMTGTIAVVLAGCVSNSSSITTAPPGVSTIYVTSTAPAGSGGLSQSVNLTLTITQ